MDEFLIGLVIILALTLGGLGGYWSGERDGAIAAHKGEIVCINIPFKEDRWECGEP